MIRLHRLRLAAALCGTLVAAACASPNPRLYTIAPVPGSEQFGAPKSLRCTVWVSRSTCSATRSYGHQRVTSLTCGANDWWGEPLDAMLARVLVEDLTQRLPQSTVYTSSGAVTGSPQATVEIEVQRLDLDRGGNLLLIAQGSVSFKNRASPDTRSFHISRAAAVAGGRRPGRGHQRGAGADGGSYRRDAGRSARRANDAGIRRRRTGRRAGWMAALRECPGCGLFQIEPALSPGMTAQCERCGTTLRRTRQHPLEHSLALALAALILLIVMCLSTLMTVRTSGIVHQAGIFSGPVELVRRGMSGLAIVVVFVTVVAPLAKLVGTIYVLLRIREAKPPRHLRRIFAWVERLSTWSMVEVFVFGVFVAYVKLGDLVTIELNTGVYALLALTFVIVWADAALDREAIWDAFDSGPRQGYVAPGHGHGTRATPGGRVRNLHAGCRAGRTRRGLPTLRVCAACPQAGKHRLDLGAGDCRRGVLSAREPVSGPYRDATWRRTTQHDPGRRAGTYSVADVSVGRTGVFCQHRRADAEDGRPDRDVGFGADRPHAVASRPNAIILHHPLDWPLVDDRHFHGGSARRACSIWRGGHHRTRDRCGGVLRGRRS